MHHEIKLDPLTRGLRFMVVLIAALCLTLVPLGASMQQAYADPEEATAEQAEDTASASSSGQEVASSSSSESTSSSSSESASSTAVSGPSVSVDVEAIAIGNDVFAAAESLESGDIFAPANLFAAARTLQLNDAVVGADALISGETLTISGLVAGNNLFVAGNNVTIEGTTATVLFAAGNNLNIAVDAESALIAGNTVFLKGVFEGDVDVTAENVIIDPYLVVRGTLNVTAESEPTIASTAKIGSFNYNQADYDESSSIPLSFSAIGSSAWLWSLLMMFLGMLLLGILMLLFLRTEVVDSAGNLVKERPLALFLSGLIGIIVLPLVIAGLFATGVGWTVALALLFAIIVVTMFAGTFTAISLGRTVLGRINKWVSSLIFIVVFALLFCLPYVNFVIGALCTLYFTGSIVQGWWVWRRAPQAGGTTGPDDAESFAFPRGNHVPQPGSGPAVPPVPASTNIPSTNPADYKPRGWSE